MISYLVILLMGSMTVFLPLLSLFIWGSILGMASPYFRKNFTRNIGWMSRDRTVKLSSLALTPWIFMITGLASVGFALFFELLFLVGVSLLITNQEIILLTTLVSAGPIEEVGKLLITILVFIPVYHMGRNRRGKNSALDGIICGLIVGGSFGFLESLTYMIQGFSLLSTNGFNFLTLDPLIWRFVLGVSIHAVFTGIASAGIGRDSWRGKLFYTLIGLSVAIFMHSLNNGVEGLASLLFNMNEIVPVIWTDVIQITFVLIDFTILVMLWRNGSS